MKHPVVLTVCLALLAMLQPAAAQAPAVSGGPRYLLITYRCDPANRPAFRAYLQGEGLARLAKFQHDGVIQGYQILFNPFNSSYTWDAMAVLSFARFEDTRRWQEIERTAPGGLSRAGLLLGKPVDTFSADLPWEDVNPAAGSDRDSVYYVIPYEYNALDQYKKYVDNYVIPQVKGWMQDGVLSGYRIFLNRYQVGRPWDSLFIYRYRDLASFGRRDEVVQKVRKTLVDDPVWKQLNDIKATVRTETENTITEALQPAAAH
jgi:DNA-binding Lrp family transcriptional regulator